MPNTVRLSGDIGPGSSISDITFTSPKSLMLDFVGMTITLVPAEGAPIISALTGVTTITDSISSNVHTIIIDK